MRVIKENKLTTGNSERNKKTSSREEKKRNSMELLKYEKTTQNTHWILKDNDEEWYKDSENKRKG